MLQIYDHIPDGLLERDAARLHEILPGPSLLHLPGRRAEPVFVSVLLHGNEDSGWEAVRTMLRDWSGRELPRALSLFVGNVAAARYGKRHLDGQPDYNRVWRGEGSDEHVMMRRVVADMRARRPFVSIDIHNNTGRNPHYGCVNRLEHRFLHLAALFSRTVVYFIRPEGVQSAAFAPLCPAVTVECGQPGQPLGAEHARSYIEACLHLTELPEHPVAAHDIDLFHTVAVVKVNDALRVDLDPRDADLRLMADIDQLNFQELPAGTPFGWVGRGQGMPLQAWTEAGEDVAARYFRMEGERLCIAVPVMPSMLTRDMEIVRQDCLCYLMERLSVPVLLDGGS